MDLASKTLDELLHYRNELFDRIEQYLDGVKLYPEELDFILETLEKISTLIST
ncbi:hypothetical protein UFOVP116_191 [uncultured Caudovirales phage]|uniref:Uncharacterized protein n=1 Tax=uncultured Caudovirales phage TaxID=2100421 RepID=A0A6J5L9E7_9CAUD|nr:hypothetical protein UFOVP116_191 [uncultured Caudovirales phage]